MKLKELHVAIPRGGLGTGVAMYIRFEDLMSPSHTVGSELKRDWDLGGRGGVAIPHGGLRTRVVLFLRPHMIPGAIPPSGLRTFEDGQNDMEVRLSLKASPSHTVGLEHDY